MLAEDWFFSIVFSTRAWFLSLFISIKNYAGKFELIKQINLGRSVVFPMLSLPIYEHSASQVFCDVFHQHFVVFSMQSLFMLDLHIIFPLFLKLL